MKRVIVPIVCLTAGMAIGWYFGYTRPSLRTLHMYQEIQKVTGASDAEMASYAQQVPEAFRAMKNQDEVAARAALVAIQILDRGDVEAAKKRLAYWVGSYYRVYHDNGDTNLIARIEGAATTSRQIAAELAKKK